MPVETTVKANETRPESIAPCPVEAAIQVIGGKWKLLLLRFLLLNGPARYNDLLAAVANISAKELTRNLGDLSAAGLIVKTPLAEDSSTVVYTLTPLGAGLMPTFQTMLVWGRQLLPVSQA